MNAPPAASDSRNQSWPHRIDGLTLAIFGFLLLAALGITGILLYTWQQDKETREYVRNHPWTQQCQAELRANTWPAQVSDRLLALHCRFVARHGGNNSTWIKIIAAGWRPAADRAKMEQYLIREQPLPGCSRHKCREPAP